MTNRIALLVVLLLVACGGSPDDGSDYTREATGGFPETGGSATGGQVTGTGGTDTGGDETGGNATGGAAPVCEPGRQVACPCVGLGEVGVQACSSDGTSWGECECPELPGTGGSGNAGAGGEGGSELPESCIEGAHYDGDGNLVWLPTSPECDCVQAVEVILICSHGEIVHKVCDEPQCL